MEKKTTKIGSLRFSDAEAADVRAAADKKEMKPDAWIRKCAVDKSRQVVKSDS